MSGRISLKTVVAGSLLLLLPLFAIGWMTREDPADTPLLGILGGGFMYNYRIGEVTYGFTAVVQKPLPYGSIIEATFEDPAGKSPHVVRTRVAADSNRYALRSPPVRGVEAGTPYNVSIRVYNRQETELLWSRDLDMRSQISDEVVPEQPLIVGPGYHRNPASVGG
jgi:hypothetical protein